jgi:hypothetical protein
LQILRRGAGLRLIELEVLYLAAKIEDRLLVILLRLAPRPGRGERPGVTVGVRLLGEGLVTMGCIGFALEGCV